MAGRKVDAGEKLIHSVIVRLNDEKYKELQRLLKSNSALTMSELLRRILYERPVKIFTKDRTIDDIMEEFSRLRYEINAIGNNINQITRLFNTYKDPRSRDKYAAQALREYEKVDAKVIELLELINKVSKKWLSE